MPAPPTSTAELVQLIRKASILTEEKLAALSKSAATLPPEPQKAALALMERGTITKFQANLLLQGRYKGFRLGSYVVLSMLGKGGMGAVYLAEHEDLRRKVAVKVLVTNKDADAKLAQDRFLREARASAALDHPNIVRIFDVGRHTDMPYLVMEYVEGENLQRMLDRGGAVPYSDAVEYIAQAAAGLQHAHEKGFVHRDIKPANMMRDNTGTIKILDMGLARTYDKNEEKLTELMDVGAIVGTADFISPEQAMNNPVDIRADIYSLGATFFALVSGKPPFEGSTTQKLMQHQLKAPPSLTSINANLPAGLTAVIGRMLAKKPEQRYDTPADVIAALGPWLPSSHRVLAGLSQTRLAEHADIQVALLDANHGGSSLRLTTVALADESYGGEMAQSGTDTADGMRATRTARTPQSTVTRTPKVAPLTDIHRNSSTIPEAPKDVSPARSSASHAPLKTRSRRWTRNRMIACGAGVAVVLGIGLAILSVNGKQTKPKPNVGMVEPQNAPNNPKPSDDN